MIGGDIYRSDEGVVTFPSGVAEEIKAVKESKWLPCIVLGFAKQITVEIKGNLCIVKEDTGRKLIELRLLPSETKELAEVLTAISEELESRQIGDLYR